MPTLLLITPENTEINRFRAKQFNNFTQLTMPYLAGFVPPEFRIRLVDEYTERVPFVRFDLVGITVNTPNAPHAYEIAKRYRQNESRFSTKATMGIDSGGIGNARNTA